MAPRPSAAVPEPEQQLASGQQLPLPSLKEKQGEDVLRGWGQQASAEGHFSIDLLQAPGQQPGSKPHDGGTSLGFSGGRTDEIQHTTPGQKGGHPVPQPGCVRGFQQALGRQA